MFAVTPDTFAKPSVKVCVVTLSALVANIKLQPIGTLISSPEELLLPTVKTVLEPLTACRLTDAVFTSSN